VTQLKVFSFGGGQQSMAALVLAAEKRIDFPTFLFANVGDDSEHPATIEYFHNYARPFAAEHGLELVELRRVMKRTGEERTLLQQLKRPGYRSIDIPARMANGAPGNRKCTGDFKIKVIGDELVRRGATEDNPATVGVGISLDEIGRANDRRRLPHELVVYPLLELGLRRTDCQRIIRSAGLPLPRKSACFFCPFKRPGEWLDMRREEPELFEQSAQLEGLLNKRRAELGRDPVWLTRFAGPLREVIPAGIDVLPFLDGGDGSCDGGWCHT